jgi:hypothetical protein
LVPIEKLSGLPTSSDEGDYVGRSPKATEESRFIGIPSSAKPITHTNRVIVRLLIVMVSVNVI